MRIPDELCREIVHHLSDRGDLYNLLFVSLPFQLGAQRALLDRVDISTVGREASARERSLRRPRELFGFLSRNIHLASAVRQFIYQPDSIEDAHLDLVIPHMTNLVHLHLKVPYTASETDIIHPSFLRCPCRLLSLSLDTSEEIPPTLIKFLKTQPTIVDLGLEVPKSISRKLFADGVLPHLTTLRIDFLQLSDFQALKVLLANRPINRMKTSIMQPIQLMDSKDFRHIRVLYCTWFDNGPGPIFENVEFLAILRDVFDVVEMGLVHRFPNLKILSITHQTLVYSPTGYKMPNFASLGTRLASLATRIVSPLTTRPTPMPPYAVASSPTLESIRAALPTLFDACHSLHTIQFITGTSSLLESGKPGEMAVFNRALELVGSKSYDQEEWMTYPLGD